MKQSPAVPSLDASFAERELLDPPSVLVVDDNPQTLEAIRATLRDVGCRFVFASNGEDALRHVLRGVFALVLLDVNMPGLDGYDTADQIRRWPAARSTPIIFLTSSFEEPALAERAYRSGAVDFITRPIAASILRAKVSAFLELSRAHKLRAELEARERSEEALRQVNRELTAAVEELQSFCHVVGHNLRAPLRSIEAFSSFAIERYRAALDEETRDDLIRIRQSGLRLGRLVDDLLAYTRLAHQTLGLKELDLRDLVTRAVAAMKEPASSSSTTFDIGRLPPAVADAGLLQQLFHELLSNAVEASRSRANPRVEVGYELIGTEATYFVRDNGDGMDCATIDRAFGLFQRLQESNDATHTGAGLAFALRIVQRHGGRLWAKSEKGHGSTFLFTLRSPQNGRDHD